MGVTRTVTRPGDNRTFPKRGDEIALHFVGRLAPNGPQFDCSKPHQPFVFKMGQNQVIPGLEQGVVNMSLGEKATLIITPDFAYGPQGAMDASGRGVPPNATLQFDVELIVINGQRAAIQDAGAGGPPQRLDAPRRTVKYRGDGKTFPQRGDTLTAHYALTLAANGQKVESSFEEGRPFSFKIGVGDVIKGLDEGVLEMSLGEAATLEIPAEMAYGRNPPPNIPRNADLVFEMQVLGINDQLAPVRIWDVIPDKIWDRKVQLGMLGVLALAICSCFVF